MPHKHTRREKDLSTFDLPPSQIAKPLPVTTISKKNAPEKKSNDPSKANANLKRKRAKDPKDDAPRAFKRLMAFAGGKKTRSGLDDGNDRGPTKKEKKAARAALAAAAAAEAGTSTTDQQQPEAAQQPEKSTTEKKEPEAEKLTIRPGERLNEFAARVDAALPITGLVGKAKNGKDPLGFKTKRTKKERQMHKMYDEWRERDEKIKEQREEELEELEETRLEEESMGISWGSVMQGGKKKKKGKAGGGGAKYFGEVGGKEEDPWEEIKRKRGEAKVGLNEVAEAPPDLRIPTKKLYSGAAVDVDDIPKAAGSLRKREELQSVREDVVASYRALMAQRREEAAKEKKAQGSSKKGKAAQPSGRFRMADK